MSDNNFRNILPNISAYIDSLHEQINELKKENEELKAQIKNEPVPGTYKVTFSKCQTYYVFANTPDEATDKGFDMLDNDKMAFVLDPVDEVTVEKVDTVGVYNDD